MFLTPYILPSFRKKRRSRSQKFFETSIFHYIFTIFKWVKFAIFQVNAESANKIFLHKTTYIPPLFQTKIALSIGESLRNIHLLQVVLVFTMDEVCYISNKYLIPNNLAKHQYFYVRDLKPFLHLRKKLALPIANVLKHPLFTTFSLFLKMSEVCNISSKCWMPNKSVTNMFLHKTFETNSSFQQKEKCALHGTSRWQLQFTKFLRI